MNGFFRKEVFRLWMTIIVITILAIAAIYFSIIGIRGASFYTEQERFGVTSNSVENQFIGDFVSNKILGVVSSAGLVNTELRRVLTSSSAKASEALPVLKALKSYYGASLVYLLNQTGDVVESTLLDDGENLRGNNYKFRPYFTNAMKGRVVLYAALGVTTNKRGLYYSAPVFRTTDEGGRRDIVGVLVMKMNVGSVDRYLSQLSLTAFMVSPDGIIFATNHQRDWLFKSFMWLNDDKVEEIRKSKQFHDRFQGETIKLPLPNENKVIAWNGVKYFISIRNLPIIDTSGQWKLILLSPVMLFSSHLLIGVSILFIVVAYLAGVLAVVSIHREKRMKRAVIEQEVANQVKNRFLANMSHEIRTPMNAVIGFTTLLLNSELNEYQLKAMKLIKTSCDNLLCLINDILDLSKIEAKKMELEDAPFDLYELLYDICHLAVSKIDHERVDFYADIDACDSYYVKGDSRRLNQVVFNLMDNAIKFTKEGQVELKLVKVAESDESLRVKIIVRDTGIGIEKKKITRIFAPFSQAETGTAREYGGTGLGLSLVKSLVVLMGGTIKLDSVFGEGTVFTLEFAFRKSKISDEDTSLEISLLPNTRVLIWDETPDSLRLHLKMLKSLGMIPDGVGDFESFHKLYRSNCYDIVLVDWRNILRRNISSLSEVLLDLDEPDAPILFAMAYNSLETLDEKDAKHVRFIQRPLFSRFLWDIFNNALLGKRTMVSDEPKE